MSPERLLKYFEQISEAPDAVPRLRRFILDLAVRGKLVDQDPEDEPASELLKRIEAEKTRLVKIGEIRKERPLPPIEESGTLFELPASWKWVQIRKITVDRGQKIPTREFCYIDVSAIDKERGLIAAPQVLIPDAAPSRARKIVQKGDVIYSCVRPYLLNIAVVEEEFNPEPIVSTAFAVLNGLGLVLPRYLWIVLRSPFFVCCVEEKMRGQAYPAINDGDFAALPSPLPPLAEQHRIVAKVDEMMTLCDELEAAQAKRERRRDRLVAATLHGLNNGNDNSEPGGHLTFEESARFYFNHLPRLTTRPEHIQQLRQTILNLAVRGKLVPQDPKDEPAAELLMRIERQRQRLFEVGEIKKPEPIEPVGEADFPFTIPSGWQVVRMGFLARKLGAGSTPLGGKSIYQIEGVPFLRSQNVHDDGLRLADVALIPRPIHERMSGTHIQRYDILLNITGASIGRCSLVPDGFPEGNVSQHVSIIRLFDPSIREFIHLSLISPVYQKLIMDVQVGVSREGLSMQRLKLFPMVLPPLGEQQRIVAKVDELIALCDELEARITATAATRHQLLEATLLEAISGHCELHQEQPHAN